MQLGQGQALTDFKTATGSANVHSKVDKMLVVPNKVWSLYAGICERQPGQSASQRSIALAGNAAHYR